MIYEYECGRCNLTFDIFIKRFKDYKKKCKCPVCKKKSDRIMSKDVSFRFQGEGTFVKGFDEYKGESK